MDPLGTMFAVGGAKGLPRCPNGTRRNHKTGRCEPKQTSQVDAPAAATQASPVTRRRCPRGSRRNPKTGRCEPSNKADASPQRPFAPTPAPIVAYLFLTHGSLLHEQPLSGFLDRAESRVYLHPKNPSDVAARHRAHIIPNRVDETSWGDISIVDATLALLDAALAADPATQWFVLLSQDVYPMVSPAAFDAMLARQPLSWFETRPPTSRDPAAPPRAPPRTSQWWILNRADAETVVRSARAFRPIFLRGMRHAKKAGDLSAPDERFFLACLRHADPNFRFYDHVSTRASWLRCVVQKSPAHFLRLTEAEAKYVRHLDAPFLRKTLAGFDPVPVPTRGRTLVVVYFGTETRPEHVAGLFPLVDRGDVSLIALSTIPVSEMPHALVSRCLSIHLIIWRFFAESADNLVVGHGPSWDRVIVLSETFTASDLAECEVTDTALAPIDRRRRTWTCDLPFTPLYLPLRDRDRRPAYLFSNTKNRFRVGDRALS